MTKPSVLLGKPLSLRLVLIVLFVLQIFAAMGLVGYLSFRNGQKAVNYLALKLQNEVSDRVDRHFDSYFNTVHVFDIAIAYQIIVEKHGGKLSVNSTPGQGAEFIMTLPI